VKKSEKYARTLEELDALHRSGMISDARYELHKAKLTTEATNGTAGIVARFSTWLFVGFLIAIGLLVVISVLSRLF
jgi:hypothetical protein